jgi:hypothetical protein
MVVASPQTRPIRRRKHPARTPAPNPPTHAHLKRPMHRNARHRRRPNQLLNLRRPSISLSQIPARITSVPRGQSQVPNPMSVQLLIEYCNLQDLQHADPLKIIDHAQSLLTTAELNRYPRYLKYIIKHELKPDQVFRSRMLLTSTPDQRAAAILAAIGHINPPAKPPPRQRKKRNIHRRKWDTASMCDGSEILRVDP